MAIAPCDNADVVFSSRGWSISTDSRDVLFMPAGWFLIAPDPLPLAVLSQAPAPTPSPEDLEKVSEERQSEATAETNTSEREVQQPNVQGRASDRVLTFEAEAEKPEETSAVIDTEHLTTASRRVVENETVESKDRGACEEVSSSPSALEDQGEIVPGIGDTTVGGDGDAGSQAAAATHKPSAPASQPAKKKKGNKEEEYWLSFAGSTQKNVLTKLPSSNGPGEGLPTLDQSIKPQRSRGLCGLWTA